MASNIARFDPRSSIARFDPFRSMESFFDAFDMMRPPRAFESEHIRMDIQETDQAYVVKAEMPGIKKEDVKVSIDGDQVTISAEVRQDEQREEGSMVCRERFHGQQYRSFTLPQYVDEEKATAACHDGILELTLPKKPGAGARQLTIQ